MYMLEKDLNSDLPPGEDIFEWYIYNDPFQSEFDFLFSNDKPMENWNPNEVVEFIYNQIPLNIARANVNHFKEFHKISGSEFCHLTEENCQFLSCSNDIGTRIYQAKQRYLHLTNHTVIANNQDNSTFDEDYLTSGNYPPMLVIDSDDNSTSDCSPTECLPKKGRPKSRHSQVKIGKRSERLWEFILHLLQDQTTCPRLIKWENFEEGTFKFVQSDKVAKLWGSRKQNTKMTYEKFSRAMRYYYKSKVLLPVRGKRLVYQFGPFAKGWQSVKPF